MNMPRRSHRRNSAPLGTLAVALILLSLLYACELAPATEPPGIPTQVSSDASRWYNLYFTGPTPDDPTGGIPDAVAASFDAAQQTIDVAVYEFDLHPLSEALIRAAERGVRVRVVTDSDSLVEQTILDLLAAKIPVVEDQRSAIMHDKFVVIDGSTVWTGSMNFTENDAYKNNNSFMEITSTRLAQNYTAEFEEMFTQREFGPGRAQRYFETKADIARVEAPVRAAPLEAIERAPRAARLHAHQQQRRLQAPENQHIRITDKREAGDDNMHLQDRQMREKGFTLIEMALALAVGTVILTGAVMGIYQILVATGRANNQVVALTDLSRAALSIRKDLLMAQTTDFVDGVPKSSANLTWTDYTTSFGSTTWTPHFSTYSLIGKQLRRNYDGIESVVGRNITSISFTQNGRSISVTISSSNTTPPSGIETLMFSVHTRSEALQ